MKALVLAGGIGTRLRPITYTSAKQLVPVANKPILFYGLESIARAGIVEVGIVVGDTADEIRTAVGDGSSFGLKISYIEQDKPLGLAHCVLIARDFLGDDDFVMYLGDNLLESGVEPSVAQFESSREAKLHDVMPSAQILLAPVDDPHRFGVAELDDDGAVKRLVEKPEDPPSNLALVGVYLFDKSIHDAVRAIEPSARGELEITDAIQWLIDNGLVVHSEVLTGWWIDTGKMTPLLEANRLLLEWIDPKIDGEFDSVSRIEGRVVIESGASIVRSTVRGPAIIGHDTTVTDSYIGPYTAIGDSCVVEHSELEHSVVMSSSRIVNVPRLVDSLIGRDVELFSSGQKPRAIRVMLGDHSQVDVGG